MGVERASGRQARHRIVDVRDASVRAFARLALFAEVIDEWPVANSWGSVGIKNINKVLFSSSSASRVMVMGRIATYP